MSRSGIYDLEYGFIPDDDVPQEPPKQTNADRIRAMTDEELANWWCFMQVAYDFQNPVETLKWLKEEVEDVSIN